MREDLFILPGGSLISREALLSVDGFDERLSGYEDDDLFLCLFRAGWDDLGKAAICRDLEAARAAIAELRVLAPTTSRQLRLKVYVAQVLMRMPAIARLSIGMWHVSKRMRRR